MAIQSLNNKFQINNLQRIKKLEYEKQNYKIY